MNDLRLQSIAEKISRDDKQAYSEFFRSKYGLYVSYAFRFLKSKAEATDIVQHAFIRLWENRSELDPNRAIVSYMYTIVRNLCLNYIRDHKDRYTELEEAALTIHHQPEIMREQDTSPEEVIQRLIQSLPDRQREAFELSRIDGLQHEEIALIMDVSPRTVNNHIVAALKSLRKAYDEQRAELLAL